MERQSKHAHLYVIYTHMDSLSNTDRRSLSGYGTSLAAHTEVTRQTKLLDSPNFGESNLDGWCLTEELPVKH